MNNEMEIPKSTEFERVKRTRGNLQEFAVKHLREFHGTNARKHPVFQGQYAAGLPMTSNLDLVNRYIVFSYSKAGIYNNGRQSAQDFDGLNEFYDFITTLPGVEIIAAHRYAALIYLGEKANLGVIEEIRSWCGKHGGGRRYSHPLID